MKNITFYNLRRPSVTSKVPRYFGKAPFSHLGLGLVLALTSEDLSRFWILRSSVMLNFSIASRFSENPLYCISSFVFVRLTTIPLLT